MGQNQEASMERSWKQADETASKEKETLDEI